MRSERDGVAIGRGEIRRHDLRGPDQEASEHGWERSDAPQDRRDERLEP